MYSVTESTEYTTTRLMLRFTRTDYRRPASLPVSLTPEEAHGSPIRNKLHGHHW